MKNYWLRLNFDEDESAKIIFEGVQNAKDVLLRISAHTKKKTSLPDTKALFQCLPLYVPIYMIMFIQKNTTTEKQIYHLDLSQL